MWENLKSNTTLAGVLLGVGMLLTQASYYFDSNPDTKPDITIILGAFGLMGVGYSAADRPKPE
jgi:hypothetical protein